MAFFKRMRSQNKSAKPAPQPTSYHLGNPKRTVAAEAKPDKAAPPEGELSYEEIKEQFLKDGVLYEDPGFLPIDESMFFTKKPPMKIEWKRPSEIIGDPCLYVDGASRFDIAQGMLGDCWLLAAVASLCQYKGLFDQVVPPGQSFVDDYCGAFRFRFWQYGEWIEVVVDDRLPTYKGKLVFLHSSQTNEFWSALLEKAYAKLCGTYEGLKGGQTSEAMEDFTGGVTEVFNPSKENNFFKLMVKAFDRQSLMCCSIDAKPGKIEEKCDNGLIKGHAYTITGIKKVKLDDGETEVQLVRIRNPWGNEREWTGAWCDSSEEWDQLSAEKKEEMGLSYDDDGEFWMSYDDFAANYTKVEICMLSPDSAGDLTAKRWEMKIYQGTWQKFVSAGGCRNFPDTFPINPQFSVKLEDPDDDEDVDNCTIVLGLIQKGRRMEKSLSGKANLTMGFAIYQIEDDAEDYKENGRLSKDYFLSHKTFARSAQFLNSREITGRFSLPPGEYVIVPSTYKKDEPGDFVLRMFSEKPHNYGVIDTCTEITIEPKEYSPEENAAFDDKYRQLFEETAGEDEEIDAFELKGMLERVFKDDMEGDDDGFSLEACRSMLIMVDHDVRNGKLDFCEFRDLWRTILEWKTSFKAYDIDNSDDMNAVELRGALSKLGIKLSTPALSSMALRYANKRGGISWDDFIQICCRVLSTYNSYNSYGGQPFTLDQFIMSSTYS